MLGQKIIVLYIKTMALHIQFIAKTKKYWNPLQRQREQEERQKQRQREREERQKEQQRKQRERDQQRQGRTRQNEGRDIKGHSHSKGKRFLDSKLFQLLCQENIFVRK